MSRLRFGLVGCGRIGQRHAGHMHLRGDLIAVCDVIKEKADSVAGSYGARSYDSIKSMFEAESDLDVVAICTPNGLHAEHSIVALRAGCHVLCEKPMAISSADCSEMIKAAEKANRRLFVVKQNRYNPPVLAVRQAIDEGKLGKIYDLQLSCFWNRNAEYYKDSWRGTRKLDGGTLYTQFSHFIDLLYWLAGDVKQTKAILKNHAHQGIIEFEDTGVVLLEFYSGTTGTINYTVNSYGKNMEGSLTIFAEHGSVKIGGQYLNVLEYQQIKDYSIQCEPVQNSANNYGFYEGSMSNHDKVYDNVVEVLQNNGTVTVSSIEGLKTVEIIEKIYNSATLT